MQMWGSVPAPPSWDGFKEPAPCQRTGCGVREKTGSWSSEPWWFPTSRPLPQEPPPRAPHRPPPSGSWLPGKPVSGPLVSVDAESLT